MSVSEVTWTPASAASWARALYSDAMDQMDAAGFAAVFTDDAWLRFGNADPVVGKAAIEAALAHFFAGFLALRHEFRGMAAHGDTLFLEATVTYTRHDAGVVTVPSMTVFNMVEHDGQRLEERCQVYADLTPLYAPS